MIPFFVVSVIDQLGYTTVARAIHYCFCVFDAPYCFPGALYYIDRVRDLCQWYTLVEVLEVFRKLLR